MTRRFVVTGASGFVGGALRLHLPASARPLRLSGEDWRANIDACDFEGSTVIHLAARVHGKGGTDADYEHDNVEKTRELAKRAARAGAARLVFLSTIKVNGEETRGGPFRREDAPAPRDAYARSKWAAEQALAAIARESALEVSVIRPPLVYGPGAKGNLAALLRLCDTPWPLPFAALDNRRSFIQVDDLARLIARCADAPNTGGATYLAAHKQALSSAMLVALVRRALGRAPRLFTMPRGFLEGLGAMVGQGERARSLTRSLEIDAGATEAELGWSAQVSPQSAIEEMVAAYRAAVSK